MKDSRVLISGQDPHTWKWELIIPILRVRLITLIPAILSSVVLVSFNYVVQVCSSVLCFEVTYDHYYFTVMCVESQQISCPAQWPSLSLHRLEETNYRLFVKRVLYFYKPSANLFCHVDLTHDQARMYAQTLLHFCDFLLGAPEVIVLISLSPTFFLSTF